MSVNVTGGRDADQMKKVERCEGEGLSVPRKAIGSALLANIVGNINKYSVHPRTAVIPQKTAELTSGDA